MPNYSFQSVASRPGNSPMAEESDTPSITSGTPFSSSPDAEYASITSYDVSNTSDSPTPSVLSLSGSMRGLAFREEFGRGVNNYSDVYRLPADEEEIDRLVKQHILFREIMGNYPTSIHDVMADTTSREQKTCLDLGCGSGSWLFDFARDFPDASAVGVDLVPLNHVDLPLNCRSEVDDINLGLDHFYGAFNVVHAQIIASGIKDYQNLINSISRVLRPAGLVILVEWDFCLHDINKRRIEDAHQLESPWWARWIAFARIAIRNLGGTLDVTQDTLEWIRANPFFENIVCEEFWIPGCQWNQADEAHLRIGAQMRDDIVNFMKAGRTLLLGSGLQEPVVDELQRKAIEELSENGFPHYVRVQRVHARRKSVI